MNFPADIIVYKMSSAPYIFCTQMLNETDFLKRIKRHVLLKFPVHEY